VNPSLGIKKPEHEAYHLPQSIAEVKDELGYALMTSVHLHVMVLAKKQFYLYFCRKLCVLQTYPLDVRAE
jgi:hypothetical protein